MNKFWKYTIGGTFQEYAIPELDDRTADDYYQVLKACGFSDYETLGSERSGASLGMQIWDHPKHGFLVEVAFVWTDTIAQVVCPDPPTLLCFLRDFSPLLQAAVLMEQIGALCNMAEETLFDSRLGLDAVVRVRESEAMEKVRLDAKYPKASKRVVVQRPPE